MLKKLYLSPVGYLISVIMSTFGRALRPFMIYGYWNTSTNTFQKLSRVSSSAVLIDKKNINIGNNCWIGHHSIIDGSNGVKIGEGVQIAGLSGIYSHSSHLAIRLCGKKYIEFSDRDRVGYVRASVEIGDYSFIGVSAIILPGVNIGQGCVIGAGSIVNVDVPDYSIVAGNPAKVIGSTLDSDVNYFDHPIVRDNYYDSKIIRQHIDDRNRESINSNLKE